MRINHKPVRRCHACLLNQADRCWGFANPRAQWRRQTHCPGFENPEAYAAFRQWQKQSNAKTSRILRREARGQPALPVFHLEQTRLSGLSRLSS